MRFPFSHAGNARILGSVALVMVLLGAAGCGVISSSTPTTTVTTAPVPPLGSQPSPAPGQTSPVTEASPTAASPSSTDTSATPTPKVAFAVLTETPTRGAAATTPSPTTPAAAKPAATTGKIAYSVATSPDEDPQFRSIWIANADGSNAHIINTYAGAPAFAPDAKQIAYYGRPTTAPEGMYIANADGGGATLVVNDATACCFKWSRDGIWIVYTDSNQKNRPGGPIKMIKLDGSKTTVDLKVAGNTPAFSPDGKQIAYSGGEPNATTLGIIVTPTDGSGALRVLTRDNGGAPQWSPDGRRIVFHAPSDDQHRQVFVINADGTGRKQLTTGKGNDVQPIWSRDGNTIFYRSDQNGTSWAIYAMNADGSNHRGLIANTPPHPDLWGWESLAVAP